MRYSQRLPLPRHGYITHIVLNAGSSAFTGINWFYAAWMMLTNFHAAVTFPQFKLQRAGDVGKDGYGWVWQANLGAHYVLVSPLEGRHMLAPSGILHLLF
jgi:3-keto steroid reductase